MATAKFIDKPSKYTTSIELFAYQKTLTEMRHVWKAGRTVGGSRRTTESVHANRADLVAAYERRCQELLADGWHDATFGGRQIFGKSKRTAKRPLRVSAAKTETALERLSAELARALTRARGEVVADRAAIQRAIERYRAVRTGAGEPPGEFLIHFFAVDGVGLAKPRRPALGRSKADQATRARWLATLEKLARRLR